MPGQLDRVLAFAARNVAHQPELRFPVKHPAPVSHRRRQPLVTVMAAHEQIRFRARDPVLRFHQRQICPCERPGAIGLIPPIHPHGVMRRGPAKQIPVLLGLADILECARIRQHAARVAHQRKAQRIRMPVPGGPWTLRARIDQHLLSRVGIRHQVKSAMLESD
jgi:hypothetical protein